MSRKIACVLVLAVAGLMAPEAFAQLTPPAGSAGAGNSPISGVPCGPANPCGVSDPSGIGNASRLPPLGTNTPVQSPSYGSVNSFQSTRPPAARYVPVPQEIIGSTDIKRHARPGRKAPFRRRGRAQVSTFTGICRGC